MYRLLHYFVIIVSFSSSLHLKATDHDLIVWHCAKAVKSVWLALEIHNLWKEREKGKLLFLATTATGSAYNAQQELGVREKIKNLNSPDFIIPSNWARLTSCLQILAQIGNRSLENTVFMMVCLRMVESIKERKWLDSALYMGYLIPTVLFLTQGETFKENHKDLLPFFGS